MCIPEWGLSFRHLSALQICRTSIERAITPDLRGTHPHNFCPRSPNRPQASLLRDCNINTLPKLLLLGEHEHCVIECGEALEFVKCGFRTHWNRDQYSSLNCDSVRSATTMLENNLRRRWSVYFGRSVRQNCRERRLGKRGLLMGDEERRGHVSKKLTVRFSSSLPDSTSKTIMLPVADSSGHRSGT